MLDFVAATPPAAFALGVILGGSLVAVIFIGRFR